MHIYVPTNTLDAENVMPTSILGLPPQSSTLLLRKLISIVTLMIGASNRLLADGIPTLPGPHPNSLSSDLRDQSPGSPQSAQCQVGSSFAGRPTAVALTTPLAMAIPSTVDPTPIAHPYVTRLEHNIKQPKVLTDRTITYSVTTRKKRDNNKNK